MGDRREEGSDQEDPELEAAMAEFRNRRKRARLFGINFEIPLTWLLGVLFFGLVQFGIFFHQFSEVKDNIIEIQKTIKLIGDGVRDVVEKNALQDAAIREHERRIEKVEP